MRPVICVCNSEPVILILSVVIQEDKMDWLSFLIGALVGWLISWLIDVLLCRPRRKAAEADLSARTVDLERESAVLRARLADGSDVKFQAGRSGAELDALRVQLAGATAELAATKELQGDLDGARAELAALRADLAGMQGLQVRFDAANAEIASLKAQLAGTAGLQAELDSVRAQLAARVPDIDLPDTGSTLRVGAQTLDLDLSAPDAAPDVDFVSPLPLVQPDKPDDLTAIEGIGPKINALFKQHGIFTFAQLAEASLERLQAILSAGGPRFAIADPSTWAEQARMARDGEWDALTRFQDSLKGGRE